MSWRLGSVQASSISYEKKAEFSSAGMQQYSWSHCSLSMHSASCRLRKASRDSDAPVFLLMRSTMPSATAFWMGTSWRDQEEAKERGALGPGTTEAEERGAWS